VSLRSAKRVSRPRGTAQGHETPVIARRGKRRDAIHRRPSTIAPRFAHDRVPLRIRAGPNADKALHRDRQRIAAHARDDGIRAARPPPDRPAAHADDKT
jgi:hypothetical protein